MIEKTATFTKNNFSEVVTDSLKEPVTVTRTGRKVAVIISIEEYSRLEAISDKEWTEKALAAKNEGFIGERVSMDTLTK